MSFDRQATVAQLVLDHPVTAQVFKSHKIDFCCRGDVTADVAAKQKGLDPAAVIAELDEAISSRAAAGTSESLGELETPALTKLIVDRHHAYLRKTLPFLRGLSAKVRRVHGDKNPKLEGVDEALKELDERLIPHLDEEETALFPYLVAGAPDRDRAQAELDSMHEEHLAVGKLLETIRAEADEFEPPSWACASYHTLMRELEAMEGDIFRHVHLETHVLMPRFTQTAA